MRRIVTADEMGRLDQYAIKHLKIPQKKLMERAGRVVFDQIVSDFKKVRGKSFLVFCGPGNNGGDGRIVSRLLKNAGAKVWINKTRPGCDAIVDALFGTGLSRKLTSSYKFWIEWINRQSCPVYAVDIPSGLNSDTGEAMGALVCATKTMAIAFPKLGFYLNEGPDHIGEVTTSDIGIPNSPTVNGHHFEIDPSDFPSLFKKRKRSSHKGTFGHALIVAGSPQKTGAAVLASLAALRTGVGLVTLATSKGAHTILKRQIVEAMSEILEEINLGKLLQNKSAVAFGPGLVPNKKNEDRLFQILSHAKVPVVIDADGLNMIASNLNRFKSRLKNTILTPHPGEMARLCKTSTQAIQKNRVQIAQTFSKQTGAIVVLKGAFTIVAFPKGSVFINPTGNPGMATGGTGDVLTGMLVGFLAQKIPLAEAVLGAVYLHGLAGDRVAQAKGPKGLLARDLIEILPSLFKLSN